MLLLVLCASLALWWPTSRDSTDGAAIENTSAEALDPSVPASAPIAPGAIPVANPEAKAVDASPADRAGQRDGQDLKPTAAPAHRRLLELERRARAGDPKAWQEWVDTLTVCTAVLSEDRPPVPEYLQHLAVAPAYDMWIAERWMAPLRADCRAMFPDFRTEAGRQRALDHIQDVLRQWATSGDPLGRLVAMQMTLQWPMPDENWRALVDLASAYLDPARPDTVLNIADGYIQTFSRFPSVAAWRLAACDLGYDCQSGGALNRRLCLQAGECFDGTYEEYLLRQMPPRQWQSLQSQRRALVELLRTGDTRTPFDVPPPGGP